MINKIRLLGQYILKNEGDDNPFNLNISLSAANVILFDFKLQGDNCQFCGTSILQYDRPRDMNLLLLKDAKGQAKSEFPTYFIGYGRNESQQRTNIGKSLKKMSATLEKNANVNPSLTPLLMEFQKSLKTLTDEAVKKIEEDKSNVCSIRINGRFIGESEYFQPVLEHFKRAPDKGYYDKYNVISLGHDNICYLCGRRRKNTYGFCDTFTFYSSNEPAYIAGGFSKEMSWKNYPVCSDCARELRLGKQFIEQYFRRNFYGNFYFLIPAPTLDMDDFYGMLQIIKEDFRDLSLKQQQENNQQIRNEMEDDVMETLSKQKDQATFTFFFYKQSQSEFKILQEAEDILPSRFKKIIEAKKQLEGDDYWEFKELKGLYKKNEYHNLSFNFGTIRTFFDDEFNNDFLDISAKILKGQSINTAVVLHRISDVISKKFRRGELYHEIRKAMIFLKFLYKLDLIEKTRGRLEVDMNNIYQDYFETHPDFYDADWKKAVFLVGVLAQHVMDIQWQERNATPFRSRLNGLKIDPRTIKRLLPEAINKLEQYKKNYYRKMEEIISRLLESGEPELRSQSVDEISFYFAMGMNLNKQFKSKEGGENE